MSGRMQLSLAVAIKIHNQAFGLVVNQFNKPTLTQKENHHDYRGYHSRLEGRRE
jgi:hypothetical protein